MLFPTPVDDSPRRQVQLQLQMQLRWAAAPAPVTVSLLSISLVHSATSFLTLKLGIPRLSRLCADQKSPDKTCTVRPLLPTPGECFQRVQMAPWRPSDACFDVQATFQLPYLNTLLYDRPNMVIYRVSKAAVDFNNVQI